MLRKTTKISIKIRDFFYRSGCLLDFDTICERMYTRETPIRTTALRKADFFAINLDKIIPRRFEMFTNTGAVQLFH